MILTSTFHLQFFSLSGMEFPGTYSDVGSTFEPSSALSVVGGELDRVNCHSRCFGEQPPGVAHHSWYSEIWGRE